MNVQQLYRVEVAGIPGTAFDFLFHAEDRADKRAAAMDRARLMAETYPRRDVNVALVTEERIATFIKQPTAA
jgi:hypothetical protein